ncbi:MAG: type VI secretion system-associated FHA domain protein [Enhygromyxa sp.]
MPPPLTEGPPRLGDAPGSGPMMLDPKADTEPPRPERPSGAEATGFVDLGGVHRAIRELRPAYEEFEVARQRFMQMVDATMAKLPASTRDTAMAFLRREFPNMPGATPFAVPASVSEGSGEGSAAVTNIAAALLHDVAPPASADEQSAFLARVAEILQTTAQAFVEIRNVQARFGEEMGVRTIREYTPLHAAGDARGVLDYLLDWRRGGPERNAQLSAVYSDFMLHQVALINGVVDGVEALIEQFRPAEIERGVGGLSKAAGAWKKYTERYAEVIEERGVAALVFGPEFARAYARVGSD